MYLQTIYTYVTVRYRPFAEWRTAFGSQFGNTWYLQSLFKKIPKLKLRRVQEYYTAQVWAMGCMSNVHLWHLTYKQTWTISRREYKKTYTFRFEVHDTCDTSNMVVVCMLCQQVTSLTLVREQNYQRQHIPWEDSLTENVDLVVRRSTLNTQSSALDSSLRVVRFIYIYSTLTRLQALRSFVWRNYNERITLNTGIANSILWRSANISLLVCKQIKR